MLDIVPKPIIWFSVSVLNIFSSSIDNFSALNCFKYPRLNESGVNAQLGPMPYFQDLPFAIIQFELLAKGLICCGSFNRNKNCNESFLQSNFLITYMVTCLNNFVLWNVSNIYKCTRSISAIGQLFANLVSSLL